MSGLTKLVKDLSNKFDEEEKVLYAPEHIETAKKLYVLYYLGWWNNRYNYNKDVTK